MEKAKTFRRKILERGSMDTEADKQAQKEAGTTVWPHSLLLRARLLNDGGYQREALRLLHGKSARDFALIEEKLEFAYLPNCSAIAKPLQPLPAHCHTRQPLPTRRTKTYCNRILS